MADFYSIETTGAADGTLNPPKKLDFRVTSAKERRIRATKPTAQAFAVGDRLYVGKLPQGGSIRGFAANFDTSLGSTTVSLGTTANPTKYVNGKTVTTTDQPVTIGPRAAAAIADPNTADEALFVTFGAAALAGGITGAFELTFTTIN